MLLAMLAYSFIIFVLTFEWGARTHKSINSFGFWPITLFPVNFSTKLAVTKIVEKQ